MFVVSRPGGSNPVRGSIFVVSRAGGSNPVRRSIFVVSRGRWVEPRQAFNMHVENQYLSEDQVRIAVSLEMTYNWFRKVLNANVNIEPLTGFDRPLHAALQILNP